MTKARLRHLIVILPGITGSVLRKDGRDIWGFSRTALTDAVFARTEYLDSLKLQGPDDPTLDDLGDGVEATVLIQDAMLVPGLFKLFSGYTGLSRMIRHRFEVEGMGLASKDPGNLFEVPYDWRRDNRVSARKLGRLIDERLALWRRHTFDDDSKVIILAHSMGGLVARYYLEVLDGWRNCLALVTFGTPFRGSVNALNSLANGYKQAFVNLTDCLRSYDSVYQLLPTYPVVSISGEFREVSAVDGLSHVTRSRAESAAGFHKEIRDRVDEHSKDAAYLTHAYKLLPFVGTRQPTFQSAIVNRGTVDVREDLPPDVDDVLVGGDGTVPRYSAVPLELDQEFRETFVPEKHGALQASGIVLDDLLGRLEQMQVAHRRPIRGPELIREGAAISLEVEDVYTAGEPVDLKARLVNTPRDAGRVVGHLSSASSDGESLAIAFTPEDGEWVARLRGLAPAMYRLEVRTEAAYPLGPPPVHDLFQVIA